MKRKLSALVLTLTLLVGTTVSASAASFTDVSEGTWYYTAVSALSDGGLIQGVGNNRFSPNSTLTYAQFCQIIARAKGFPSGTQNGYWAYQAIQSCVQAGYLIPLGEITPQNYDIPITREAAISAVYFARQDKLAMSTKNIRAEDIPDYDQISSEYQSAILCAYNYGITNGNDSKKTFSPKSNLTRAQMCQVLYNINWTRAAS